MAYKLSANPSNSTAAVLSTDQDTSQPTVPKADTPAPSFGQEALGVGNATGNFFEGLIKSTIGGIKTLGSMVKAIPEGIGDISTLDQETEMTNKRTAAVTAELNKAAALPVRSNTRKKAIAAIGSPEKYFDADTQKSVANLYSSLGLTPDMSTFSIVKKMSSNTLNAAFSVSIFDAPLNLASKAAGDALYAVTDGTIYGALVTQGMLSTGELATRDVASSTAKVIGSKIVEEAEPGTQTTLKTAVDYGKKILTRDKSLNLVGKMIGTGLQNSAISVYSDWANGMNLKDPTQQKQALKDAGVAFVTGFGLEGAIEGGTKVASKVVGTIADTVAENKAIKSAPTDLANIKDELNQTYTSLRVNAVMQSLDEQATTGEEAIKSGNASNRTKAAKDAYTSLISQVRGFSTHDEAIANIQTEYGATITALEPDSGQLSGVKKTSDGYQVNFKKGDFEDAMQQVGKAVTKISKDQGLVVTYLDDELNTIPKTGVPELDNRTQKMADIFQGLQSDNAAQFRAKYPKTAALFDSVYGTITGISDADASKKYVQDTIPEHYEAVDYMIKRESNGDPQKADQLWSDLYDTLKNPQYSAKANVQRVMDTVEESNRVLELKKQANIEAQKNPTLKALYDKADEVDKQTFGVGKKETVWKTFFQSIGKDVPVVKSPFSDLPSPTESDLGTPKSTPPEPQGEQPVKTEGTTQPAPPEEKPAKPITSPDDTARAEKAAAGDEETPTTSKENLVEQRSIAESLVSDNPDKAMSVALGNEDATKYGFNNSTTGKQYVISALLNRALEEGDAAKAALLEPLQKTSDTLAGKALVATKMSVDTRTGAYQEAIAALKEGKPNVDKSVDKSLTELSNSIKENSLTDEQTQNLVDKLTC